MGGVRDERDDGHQGDARTEDPARLLGPDADEPVLIGTVHRDQADPQRREQQGPGQIPSGGVPAESQHDRETGRDHAGQRVERNAARGVVNLPVLLTPHPRPGNRHRFVAHRRYRRPRRHPRLGPGAGLGQRSPRRLGVRRPQHDHGSAADSETGDPVVGPQRRDAAREGQN